MGTALTARDANKGLSHAELLARLQTSVEESQTVNSKFLNFDGRFGKFAVPNGTDEPDTFAPGQLLLLSLFESKKAYVCWKGGQVIDSKEYSLFEPMPAVSSMEDHGPYSPNPQDREGWKLQYVLFLKLVEGGKQYQLKLSSISATRAFGAFMQELIEGGAMYDFTQQTPVIKLSAEKFKHNGNWNFKPKFEISSWEQNPTEEAAPAAAVTDQTATEAVATETAAAMPASRKK